MISNLLRVLNITFFSVFIYFKRLDRLIVVELIRRTNLENKEIRGKIKPERKQLSEQLLTALPNGLCGLFKIWKPGNQPVFRNP
jgi:hypothetical protein